MKAEWIGVYDKNKPEYEGAEHSILINISQIVYLRPKYPYYLLVTAAGEFYINSKDADKIKEGMIF